MAGSLAAHAGHEGVDITPVMRNVERHRTNTIQRCSDCKTEVTGTH
jgi:hypothetical protein